MSVSTVVEERVDAVLPGDGFEESVIVGVPNIGGARVYGLKFLATVRKRDLGGKTFKANLLLGRLVIQIGNL